MLTFSQRMGLAKIRTTIQTDDLDQPTRNALWNIVGPFFKKYSEHCSVYKDIWTELYHNTSDTNGIQKSFHTHLTGRFLPPMNTIVCSKSTWLDTGSSKIGFYR